MRKSEIWLLTLIACAWPTLGWAQLAAPSANRLERSVSAATPASIPLAAQPAISDALGRSDSGFQAKLVDNGLHADNTPHGMAADFTRKGIELRHGKVRWGLRLRGFGYGNALTTVHEASPSSSANRVEYRRESLTEWYVNGPLGLEQGFTLKEPPGRRNGRPLTIALGMSGDLKASIEAGGNGVALRGSDGETEIRYSGLSARDAAGHEFRAWMEIQGQRLLLKVDDAGARYPLVVDPFIQEAVLPGAVSLAISSDNNTVALAGSSPGVTVFVKSGSSWNQVAVLVPRPNPGNPYLTCDSLALSGDGNTVICGKIAADSPVVSAPGFGPGEAYVFVKPGSGWTGMTATATLYASDLGIDAEFGISVASSGDGSTLLVGATQPTSSYPGVGGAYVYLRPSTGWPSLMTQSGKLEPSDGTTGDQFGISVAISGDGQTAAVTHFTPAGAGAGYVFESASPWPSLTTAPASLTPSVVALGFGLSVAMSRDGSTLVFGAAGYKGEALVFAKDPSLGWTTTNEAAILAASDGVDCDYLGNSVSISADGSHILAGAPQHTALGQGTGPDRCVPSYGGLGAVYEFVRPAGGWSSETQTSKLISPIGLINTLFGNSVAISDDTSRVVVSAPSKNVTYVFHQPITPIISWPPPAAITYGTPLSGTQLDATANVAGTLIYTPAANTVLPAGNQTLSVNFTPTDTTNYTNATATNGIIVNKATPAVSWSIPAAITYGTALSGTQLNATASVPGTFLYSPAAGTVLAAGNHPLSATFIPSDTADYNSVSIGTSVFVNKAILTVTATSLVQPYGMGIPPLTYSFTGFVNKDTASAVSGAPTLATLATPSSLPGIYPISIGIGTLAAANYSFNLVAGTFTLSITVGPGQCVPFPVNLAASAGPSGADITLTSSDPSTVTMTNNVNPILVFIPAGATQPAPRRIPEVCGVNFGTATVTAPPGGVALAPFTQTVVVQVTATLSFAPASVTVTAIRQARLTLNLSAPAPAGGLTVNLSSDNPGVATVPLQATIPANGTSVTISVTGVATGSTLIHASALPNVPDTTAIVTVP